MKRLTLCLLLTSLVWAKPYEPQVQHSEVPKPVTLPEMAPPPEMKAGEALGVMDALRIAFLYQSSLKGAQAQVRASQGRTDQQAAGLNPRLSLTTTYTDQLINSLSGTGVGGFIAGGGWNYQANLNQLLFDFGHTRDLVRSQEELTRAAQAAYEQAQADLVLQVKQAYYTLLQSQRLVKVQEDNLVNRREHVTQATSRFRAGLGLPSDVTRAESALSSGLFQLSQAQTKAANDRLQLSLLLGLDPRVPLAIREEQEQPLAIQQTQELFDKALAQRQELLQFQSNVAAAQAALDAAHTQSAPTLSTNLTYNNRSQPAFQTLGINLALAFNAYDGGLQDGKVSEAEANLDKAQADLEGARQRVLSQVGQAYLNLKNAEQQVTAALAEEANARETLRLTDGRYKVGLGIFLDVLDAQSAYLTAQTNRVNAQTTVDLSRAALARSIGEKTPLP